ncbi:MAG: M23 family metallopeptidase [Acidimicrobiales bacterium]
MALFAVAVVAAGCRSDGLNATLAAGLPSSTTTTAAVATTEAAISTVASAQPPTTRPAATTTAAAPKTATTPPTTAAPAAPVAAPADTRRVHEQAWAPFAEVGGVTLLHPSSRVELIGYHESNLDGARQMEPVGTSAPVFTLEGRDRDTGNRTAADIVVDPASEIRAPVSGKVLYSGTYVLYCKYSDDFLIIEPDSHPGWEVKVLHIDGVRVRPGARVIAGQTVIAPRATVLPFASQVEEMATTPPWPHVHVEVDDPTIPDRPTGGGC